MFTINHFIWLLLCAMLITGLLILSLLKKFTFKTASIIMGLTAVISEFFKIMLGMKLVNPDDPLSGMILKPGNLPFHLCSMFIFVFFALPFTKDSVIRRRVLSFFVPIGFIGATFALLIPTNGVDFLEVDPYLGFGYHVVMIWFALYLIFTKQVNLGLSNYFKNLATIFCISIIMIWVNSVLSVYDTNFLFVVRPPMENLPILNLNHGWYVYYLTLIICGALGFTIVHAPQIISDIINKRK